MENSNKDKNFFQKAASYLFPSKGDPAKEVVRKLVFLTAAVALVVFVSILTTNIVKQNIQNSKDKEISDLHSKDKELADQSRAEESSLAASSAPASSAAPSSVPVSSAPAEESDPYIDYPPREITKEFDNLLSINPETIGWLTIRSASSGSLWIDYPLLQTDDNSKYLTTNFYGESSKSGALYVDYRDKITATSQPANIVVYGHNMASGEYFGRLPFYFNYAGSLGNKNDISFYQDHPTIELSTLYGSSVYKIFAMMLVNTEEDAGEVFVYYPKHNFSDRADFNEYVGEILDRSTFYNPDVPVTYGDRLLTLSTCMFGRDYYGDTDLRFVVFARETREGESETVDVSKAYANPNPKFYDLYYRINNYVWEGRKWDKKLLEGYEGP